MAATRVPSTSAMGARSEDAGKQGIGLGFELAELFEVAGMAHVVDEGMEPREGSVDIDAFVAVEAPGEGGGSRAEHAQQHRADIDGIAILLEERLLVVTEIGERAGGAPAERRPLSASGATIQLASGSEVASAAPRREEQFRQGADDVVG